MHVARVVAVVLAGLLIAGVAVFAWLLRGSGSLRAEWQRDVARLGASNPVAEGPAPRVTEADLASLPPALARYLRVAGVVGQPRVRSFAVRFTGRIRGGPDEPWMPFRAEQESRIDGPVRLFYMEATRGGLPITGYHRFVDGAATMRVKVLGAFPVVDAGGVEFTATEAVTVLNDLCLMAPAALLDIPARFTPAPDGDERSVGVDFTAVGHTVHATLRFDAEGRLADFVSDDRGALAKDGKTFERLRWSTPVRERGTFGALHVASFGEARYAAPAGDYAYGEFRIESLVMNPRPAPAR